MNKERFISLVKNPALLKAQDASFLEEILNEFPFFQSAHLLAARCYKVNDSIHLQKQIKKAAAHIIDRKVLYNLIENFQTTENTEEITIAESVKIESTITGAENEVTAKKDAIATPRESISTFISEAKELIFEEESNQEVLIEEITIDDVEHHALIEDLGNKAMLENDIDIEKQSVNVISKVEVLHENALDAEKLATTFEVVEAEIPLEKEIKIALAESIYLQEFEQNLPNNSDISAKNEEIVQTSAIVPEEILEKTEIEEQKEHESQNLTQTTDFVAWLKNLQQNESSPPNPAPKKHTNEGEKLIEAFMEKPLQRAKPVKQEFYSPVNMAKHSVSDNDFFVTETLAKIYIKQGNLAKAIKVYQNLSLKNPEKNIIFAAQIKILKEQLHNKTGK
jgi:hypothetical protein